MGGSHLCKIYCDVLLLLKVARMCVDARQLFHHTMILLEILPRLHRSRVRIGVIENDIAAHLHKTIQVVQNILVRIIEITVHAQDCNFCGGIVGVKLRQCVFEETLVKDNLRIHRLVHLKISTHRFFGNCEESLAPAVV